ncbi:hypothetical protein ACGFNU_00470 [Spirillospora sp. NPDC048911]|uniref:hypothetical protein n=1 Tax=Spirillospora sp. NPDC048911 TaxID=3364527 RepID=UPI003721EB12
MREAAALTVEELAEQARRLEPAQLDLLREMTESLLRPNMEYLKPDSDLISNGFGESFLNRLKIHHATSDEKFKKGSFEYAFVAAAKFAGRRARKTTSNTHQGADVLIDEVRWSLKTEAAASISRTGIRISKFSEARWIRDCPDEYRAERARERIYKHLSEYERIATLRAFTAGRNTIQYDLVEIPLNLLKSVRNLKQNDFRGKLNGTGVGSGGSALVFQLNGKKAFSLKLDNSVEKITLSGIPVSDCILHASWRVEFPPELVDVDNDE